MLDINKMGYFILIRNEGGFIGNSIEREQKKKFNDYDAQFTHIMVSGGGQYAVHVAPPKTRIIDFTKTYKGRYIVITKYKAKDYSIKRYKVAFWAASHCNLKYDFHGIIAFLVRWFREKTNKWFCSENSLWALKKEYKNALNIDPRECMPAHFLGKDFEVVWKGLIL